MVFVEKQRSLQADSLYYILPTVLPEHTQRLTLMAAFAACIAIFFADVLVVSDSDVDFLYLLPVFATVLTRQRFSTLAVVALAGVLLIVGIALRIENGYTGESWLGRLLALIGLGAALVVVQRFKYLMDQQIEQQVQMEHLYNERLRAVRQFESVFEQVSEGVIVVNKAGDIALINAMGANLFGYEKMALLGKPIEYLIPDRFFSKHQQYRHNYIHHPRTRAMGAGLDLYGKRADGSEFPLAISLSPYQTDVGEFVIAFVLDITERKRHEAEIQQMNADLEALVAARTKALQASLAFQNALVTHAGVIIVATDSDGVIRLFNPEAEKRLGYTAEEVVGIHNPLLFHSMPQVEQRAKQFSEEFGITIPAGFEVFTIKALRHMPNEHEWTYITKAGARFPVSLIVTAVSDEKGAPTGFACFAVDISIQKALEHNLMSALRKEKELHELKSRFVSMASHEFRTPLTGITSSASLIGRYAERQDFAQIKKHSELIKGSVDNLNSIIADFLSLGKLEEGGVVAQWQEILVADCIENIRDHLSGTFKAGQTLVHHHQGNDGFLSDPVILKNIFINLVGNASKYSAEGATITVESEIGPEAVVFRITDEGIGIPPADMEHLFNRFFRASNVVNIKGTGLGLYIVKHYAELLNGRISCQSTLGQGSSFTVVFPQNSR